MKKIIAEFILFYYESYIYTDWNEYTKLGRIFTRPAGFVRAIILWVISPISLLEFFVKRSKRYKEFMKMYNQIVRDGI